MCAMRGVPTLILLFLALQPSLPGGLPLGGSIGIHSPSSHRQCWPEETCISSTEEEEEGLWLACHGVERGGVGGLEPFKAGMLLRLRGGGGKTRKKPKPWLSERNFRKDVASRNHGGLFAKRAERKPWEHFVDEGFTGRMTMTHARTSTLSLIGPTPCLDLEIFLVPYHDGHGQRGLRERERQRQRERDSERKERKERGERDSWKHTHVQI